MIRTACALTLLSLAACDGDRGGAPQNVTRIKAQSAYVEKLRALSPQNRDLTLRRAVQDSGQSCKRIITSQETGAYKNMATWTTRCEGGRDWAVFIAPNGDAQVRSCEHLGQLGLPGCGKATP